MGVLDKLASASTGTKQVELILDAALDARWEELSRQLDTAYEADAKLLVQDTGSADAGPQGPSLALPSTTKVVDEMEEIRDRVIASTVTFWFAPMDWRERIALQAEHPPQEGNLLDQTRGYNALTFVPALIRASCVRVVDQDGDESTDIPDATWDHLLGNPAANPPVKPTLTHRQVSKLFAAAQQTDDGARIPPSARSLLGIQDSGASLAQPSPGTSPRSGSAAGSRRTSRRSSTAKKAAPKKAASSGS